MKDTANSLGVRLDTTLYVDQNMSQTCQPKISETLKLWISFVKKKTGRFYPKHGDFKILDYRLSLQFQSVSSSIEVLLGVSDLFDADVSIFIFLYSTKMLFDGSLGIIRLFQKLLVCYWTHLPTFVPHNCLHLIKICAYSHVTI